MYFPSPRNSIGTSSNQVALIPATPPTLAGLPIAHPRLTLHFVQRAAMADTHWHPLHFIVWAATLGFFVDFLQLVKIFAQRKLHPALATQSHKPLFRSPPSLSKTPKPHLWKLHLFLCHTDSKNLRFFTVPKLIADSRT